MRTSRFFDLIGQGFAVLILGGFLILVLFTIVGSLYVAGAEGLAPFLNTVGVWVSIIAVFGGMLLTLYAGPRLAKWAWQQLGGKGQEWLVNALLFVIGSAVVLAIYQFWQVPEIGDRPISSLTLNELAQNFFKYGILFMLGLGVLRAGVKLVLEFWGLL
jgi:hypothetical protein